MATDPIIRSDPRAQGVTAVPAVESSVQVVRDGTSLQTELSEKLRGKRARFLAQAPGRLDVMGGIAEYTGSLVLHWPIQSTVSVVAQPRSDQEAWITHCGDGVAPPSHTPDGCAGHTTKDRDVTHRVSLSRLRASADKADGQLKSIFDPEWDVRTRIVVAVLVELFRRGLLTGSSKGTSVVTGSTFEHSADLGQTASLAVATVLAVCKAADKQIKPMEVADLCQYVENHYLDMPCGAGDAITALVGELDHLLQTTCCPADSGGSVRLPAGVTVVGIRCGSWVTDGVVRYRRARTAAYMGRLLIQKIIDHDGADGLTWKGHLARLGISDFVQRFRDRLPTKITGEDFLSRFGETGDPLTRIEPKFVYKVRSRTEHHVYENARAHQFAQRLSRAARLGDRNITIQAGELMYASHWSHGQRCGLGSIPTEQMVTLLRRRGTEAGILGAKIAGRACGSLVVVLLDDTQEARASVDEVIRQYQAETGQTASTLTGSSAGAITTGVREIS